MAISYWRTEYTIFYYLAVFGLETGVGAVAVQLRLLVLSARQTSGPSGGAREQSPGPRAMPTNIPFSLPSWPDITTRTVTGTGGENLHKKKRACYR